MSLSIGKRLWSPGLALWLGLSLVLNLLAVAPAAPARAEDFASPVFRTLWNRTDAPASNGAVSRPLFWGQAAIATRTERYDNSPGGQRQVQYFDKGRMEITYPNGDQSNEWYVSSGLLVRDLIGGIVQVGDNVAQEYEPAQIPVVGDETNPLPITPLYSDFQSAAFSSVPRPSEVGQPISGTIQHNQNSATRPTSAHPQVKIAYYETTSQHNIAAPFWDFMNATGPVQAPNGQTVDGPLFEWQYLLGYPMTEPYWTAANFNGQSQVVLIQLFQRRILVFNPATAPGFQVDFANVGRHWYEWQYGPPPTSAGGDTSAPASVSATINPTFGDVDTLFHFTATGFKPGEKIAIQLTQPTGRVYPFTPAFVADKSGATSQSFYGGDLSTSANEGVGIYRLDLKGIDSGHLSIVFWRIVPHVPVTPATPYTNDTSPPPPGVHAGADPAVGPRGTLFNVFIDGFHIKELAQRKLSAWITTPEGQVVGLDSELGLLIVDAQESLEGMSLVLIGPGRPGIWALTIADKANPSRLAIVYLKVTGAPFEGTIGASLRVFTAGRPQTDRAHAWESTLRLPDQPTSEGDTSND